MTRNYNLTLSDYPVNTPDQHMIKDTVKVSYTLFRMCEDTVSCRRVHIMGHYGQDAEHGSHNCGNCDICLSVHAFDIEVDVCILANEIIKYAQENDRGHSRYTVERLCNIICKEKAKILLKLQEHHGSLLPYGLGHDNIRRVILKLVLLGVFEEYGIRNQSSRYQDINWYIKVGYLRDFPQHKVI